MAYTTIDNPELHFQTKTYTGDQTANRLITLDGSEDMQPDWVWIKNREVSVSHDLYDSVRGVTKYIMTASSSAEATNADGLVGFNTDGFTVDTSWGNAYSGNDLVAWCWKAGTSFSNDASATSVGTIDSTGSINTTAGFSIISYTGTGSTGTVAHGLGSAPEMIIVKNRSASQNWVVYHQSLNGTKAMFLNTTSAAETNSNWFNDTSPTSTVFSVGTYDAVVGNGHNLIAYCFSEVKGYSKFGSYTGNGNADGTYVHLGFKPSMVICKASSTDGDWKIFDNKRIGYNAANYRLYPNANTVETSDSLIDILSNGFKLKTSSDSINGSGNTVIYMAFAESPFVNSNGVPNNAR